MPEHHSTESLNGSALTLGECFDRNGCDKGLRHGYEAAYEPVFELRRDEKLRILEVGIFGGASICAWLDYFPNATITGIDTFQRVESHEIEVLKDPRVTWHAADSRDINLLGEFDIIIDDGLHTFEGQRRTFENLIGNCTWRYFIEDCWPLSLMTPTERKHPWLARPGFSQDEYVELIRVIAPYDQTVHDLRKGHQPDSCIYEIWP